MFTVDVMVENVKTRKKQLNEKKRKRKNLEEVAVVVVGSRGRDKIKDEHPKAFVIVYRDR